MAIGGGGIQSLFWVPPVTGGNLTAWLTPGVLEDSGVPIGGGGRTVLAANTNFFVSHDTGNDGNDGSVGSPWATIQHAVDIITHTLDINGFTITIHVADSASTYAGVQWTAFIGGGNIVFLGNNTTLGNVKVGNSVGVFTLGSFFSGGGNIGTLIWVSGFDMHPTAGPCFDCDGVDRGFILLGEPTFLLPSKNKYSSCQANSYVIIGNVFDNTLDTSVIDGTALSALTPKAFMLLANTSGQDVFVFLGNFLITGTLVVSNAFVVIDAKGAEVEGSITAGAVTGKKFDIRAGGALYVTSLTSLPGSLPGNNDGILSFGSPVTTYLGCEIFFVRNLPALFTVENVGGNNWFEGNAGNLTVTGAGNFGTGDEVLLNLTTGFSNVAIGGTSPSGAGFGITGREFTTAHGNVAIGAGAMSVCHTGAGNFAIGTDALTRVNDDVDNTGIGVSAMQSLSSNAGVRCQGNIGIGAFAFNFMNQSSFSVGIGNNVAQNLITGGFDVFIGFQAGTQLSASGGNNTFIGTNAGQQFTTATNCTILGTWLGAAVVISNVIGISNGVTGQRLDYNYTNSQIWSFQHLANAQGLHVYNTTDGLAPPTNYERAIFDWNSVANVLVIGTQKGGTGSTRNLEFIIGGTNELDYGVTNAGLWTFAQATMFATSVGLTNGAAASLGTLTNAPAAGNPTKWVPINDNGTTRFIPAW